MKNTSIMWQALPSKKRPQHQHAKINRAGISVIQLHVQKVFFIINILGLNPTTLMDFKLPTTTSKDLVVQECRLGLSKETS